MDKPYAELWLADPLHPLITHRTATYHPALHMKVQERPHLAIGDRRRNPVDSGDVTRELK